MRLRKITKLQHRISNILMLGIENVLDHSFTLKKGQLVDDPAKNEVLRSFIAAKDVSSGRFLFRSHLSLLVLVRGT